MPLRAARLAFAADVLLARVLSLPTYTSPAPQLLHTPGITLLSKIIETMIDRAAS